MSEDERTTNNQIILMENTPKIVSLNLNIAGMTCANCALKINTKLQSLEGVQKADVVLPTESAQVIFDSSNTDINKILHAVSDIGYQATLSKIIISLQEPLKIINEKKIKENLTETSGIFSVNYQEEKNQLKIIFNSGVISENGVMKSFLKLGVKGKKSQGILEQERENYENEISHRKRLLIISFIFVVPMFIIGQLMMRTTIFMGYMQTIRWIMFGMTTIVQILVGSYFYKGAYSSLKNKTTNMDVLIALGSGVSYIYSTYVTIIGVGEIFFVESVMIFGFIALGKWLEAIAKGKTSTAITKLMEMKATSARVLRNGQEIEIDIDEVDVNEIIIVKPGEKIPIDGKIIEGTSRIDESMITGESISVKKKIDDIVIGGTINQNGLLKIRVEKIGNDTVLNRIIEMVRNAQTQKAPLQLLADKASNVFVPLVILIASITFAVWYYIFSFTFENALLRFVTVVVISCPCALGLAIPTAVMVGTGQGAKTGILIKGGESLESIHKVNTIVFDKTGTLTIGKPQVTDIIALGKTTDKELLYFSATLESGSEHPLGKAILEKATEYQISLGTLSDFKNNSGYGIEGKVDNIDIQIGNIRYVNNLKIEISTHLPMIEQLQSFGKTVVLVIKKAELIGILGISDELKQYAKETIEELHKLKIKTYILTGDNEKTARAIAKSVGVRDYFAEVLPSQKLAKIEELQNKDGAVVAMVGDGINDAPALTKADVGIAIGSGTDIAIESADIVLMQGDLRNIVMAIILSKKTYDKMVQNLFWAAIYNIIGIPFAAGVFYFLLGFFLPPGIASLAMAISSVSVVTSALLLKRLNLTKIKEQIRLNSKRPSSQETITQDMKESKIKESELVENNIEKGTEVNNKMATKLVCEKCGQEEALPKHCGRDMIPHEGELVCWMNLDPKFGGMKCGQQSIPEHCNVQMKAV
jgi:P-type Cu+ transporter